jgi:uncharacterized protein involved in exopolysaccharide biosynthesis
MQGVLVELAKGAASIESRSLRRVIEAGYRHWRLFAGMVGTVFLLAILFTLFSKKQYQSEMKLLIQNARTNSVITADRSAAPSTSDVTEQEINSELEVLQSADVLGQVADPGWNPADKKNMTPQQLKAHELKVTQTRKRLSIEAARKSNVIDISALNPDPKEANETLQRLTDAYMAQRKRLSRPGGATQFFSEEAARYLSEWQQANNKLVEFQQQNHLVSVPETEENIKRELDRVNSDLQTANVSLGETNHKLNAVGHQLQGVPSRQSTQQRTLANQYSIQQMQTLLVQLANKRTEAVTRYKSTDPLVQDIDHQIANTQDALKQAIADKQQEDTTDVSPVWQQLKGSSSLEQVNRSALMGRIASLNIAKDDLQKRLAKAQDLAVRYDNLKTRTEEAQNNYKTFSEKRDQAQIEDAMDEHQLVNVAVAESPTLSYRAYSPKPLQNLALGLLTGLFLACGLVYFAELSRSTIANAQELEAFSSTPVLASIPLDALPGGAAAPNKFATASSQPADNAYPKNGRLAHAVQQVNAAAQRIAER